MYENVHSKIQLHNPHAIHQKYNVSVLDNTGIAYLVPAVTDGIGQYSQLHEYFSSTSLPRYYRIPNYRIIL